MRKAKDLRELESLIGYTFINRELLLEAFTHSSYSAEKKKDIPHNERLEFFGDSVLQLITSESLFHLYPKSPEGFLTKMRSAMTRKEGLAVLATHLDLGSYLKLGKGENRAGGYLLESTLENTFEAFVGALYLDGGYEIVRDFVIQCHNDCWPNPEALLAQSNPKGELQEFSQSTFRSLPIYRTVSRTGPEHQPIFSVEVKVGEHCFTAEGKSRRDAESQAASVALSVLNP